MRSAEAGRGVAYTVWRDRDACRNGIETRMRPGHGDDGLADRRRGSGLDARGRYRECDPDRNRELIRPNLQRLPKYSADAALWQVRAHRIGRIWRDELVYSYAVAAASAHRHRFSNRRSADWSGLHRIRWKGEVLRREFVGFFRSSHSAGARHGPQLQSGHDRLYGYTDRCARSGRPQFHRSHVAG